MPQSNRQNRWLRQYLVHLRIDLAQTRRKRNSGVIVKLELRKIGEHYFFVLPADLVAQSDWANGDIFEAAVDGDAF